MRQEGFYSGLTEDEIAAKLGSEGLKPRRVSEAPFSRYESHKNRNDLVLAFVKGSAEIHVGDKVFYCQAGDRLVINGWMPHSGIVGAEGCVYWVTNIPTSGD